jgi:hypothetical protein
MTARAWHNPAPKPAPRAREATRGHNRVHNRGQQVCAFEGKSTADRHRHAGHHGSRFAHAIAAKLPAFGEARSVWRVAAGPGIITKVPSTLEDSGRNLSIVER